MLSRRTVVGYIATLGLTLTQLARGDEEPQEAEKPFGWLMSPFEKRRVYVQGSGDRVVVLMHEINGLSPGCVDLGDQLVDRGFKVYMPLFFGHPTQDSTSLGFLESCVFGHFHCFAEAGRDTEISPVQWTSRFVKHICAQSEVRAVGMIGMCQTGAFPLAAMEMSSKVKGVIMSQPAMPFGEARQRGVGIGETTMKAAKESKIPILAFRFNADTLCTAARLDYLENYFGKEQFRRESFDCPGFHSTMSHRLHAVLTGPCRSAREEARVKAIAFLSTKLDR